MVLFRKHSSDLFPAQNSSLGKKKAVFHCSWNWGKSPLSDVLCSHHLPSPPAGFSTLAGARLSSELHSFVPLLLLFTLLKWPFLAPSLKHTHPWSPGSDTTSSMKPSWICPVGLKQSCLWTMKLFEPLGFLSISYLSSLAWWWALEDTFQRSFILRAMYRAWPVAVRHLHVWWMKEAWKYGRYCGPYPNSCQPLNLAP